MRLVVGNLQLQRHDIFYSLCMSVLKVGVLTFHRCINYGSYWQAKSLVESLRVRGHNASILDHHSRRINISEWKCALQPVLPIPIPKQDHSLYKEKIRRFFSAFEKLPLSSRFSIDQPEEMDEYDVVVVGSDEVWNLFHPWYGNYTFFYGEGIRAQRLISYAASFGNYPASWGLDQTWSQRLLNFDAISVRDENSWWLVKNATGAEPEMVLDPCLQFPVVPEERECDIWNKPYIAVYGHNFTETFIHEIRRSAKLRDLPLISIGYRNDWADEQWIDADPHHFAHFMAKSEAVATNFFHGCVFALRNQKPFACETTSYRSHKVQGLMEKVGGEKHLVNEDTLSTVYERLLAEPLDTTILQKIDVLRQNSNEYLDQALDLNQIKRA